MNHLAPRPSQAATPTRKRFAAPRPSTRRSTQSPAKPTILVVAPGKIGLSSDHSCGGYGILGKPIEVASARGRPAKARERVLLAFRDEVAAGNPTPTLSRLARRAHIGDFRNVRRILRDLRRLGEVTA